jgi:putative membrane protein insertion efficiency factor
VTAGWLTLAILGPLVLFDLCAAFVPVSRRAGAGGAEPGGAEPGVGFRRWSRRRDGAVRGPLAALARIGIGTYRAAFAGRPITGCRFEPSCSTYALEAVRRFGGVGGGLLAVRRLLRCQPLCAGGFDPVPRWRGSQDQPAGPTATVGMIAPRRGSRA